MTHNNQSPIRFLFLKLPPPPCAVLLVYILNVSLGGEEKRQFFRTGELHKLDFISEPKIFIPIGSMGLTYLPTFVVNIQPNVGRYTIHGPYGDILDVLLLTLHHSKLKTR